MRLADSDSSQREEAIAHIFRFLANILGVTPNFEPPNHKWQFIHDRLVEIPLQLHHNVQRHESVQF